MLKQAAGMSGTIRRIGPQSDAVRRRRQAPLAQPALGGRCTDPSYPGEHGGAAEWFEAAKLEMCREGTPPGVRISPPPPSPDLKVFKPETYGVMTTLMIETIKWAIEHKFAFINLSTGKDLSKLRWKPTEISFRTLCSRRLRSEKGLPSAPIFGYVGAAAVQSLIDHAA